MSRTGCLCQALALIVSCFQLLCLSLLQEGSSRQNRVGKLLPIFQIVRFTNDPCMGADNKNGTCYTQEECATRNGAPDGTCAGGYGVCCIFSLSCGTTSSENCTYFEAPENTQSTCSFKVCKCNPNICQLRLDFLTFSITGPSTDNKGSIKLLNGIASNSDNARQANLNTRCLTDTFTVTNPGGPSPPVICGANSMEHMYVDASRMCNDLIFQLGSTGIEASIVNRAWSIKISQYSCDFGNLAPDGCTQYFYGSPSDSVRSYNYGHHLANQRQAICVRRERGNCRICWTTVADTDFEVSGRTDAALGFVDTGKCCGYGVKGDVTRGYDCVIIPGAEKVTAGTSLVGNRFCGRDKGLVTMDSLVAKTICSTREPFLLTFLSDNWEFAGGSKEAKNQDQGVKLTFIQDAEQCAT